LTPSLGLSLIARDEEANLPRLLASISGAFDQIALADTGSEDRTVEVFEEWAAGQDLPLGWRVGSFDWCDDFAAAREFADSLLATDWRAFADADDTLTGADELRPLVEEVTPDVGCIAFDYLGDDRQDGPRVRLCRRGWTCWYGPAHAVPILVRPAQIVVVPPEVTAWQHHRTDRTASDERDRRILAGWLAAEPDNPRALGLSANDLMRRGERGRAADLLDRYLDSPKIRRALGPRGLDVARRALADLRDGATDAVAPVLFGGMVS
jgi:glycosyltransferase involved in cell wall biosynthesis